MPNSVRVSAVIFSVAMLGNLLLVVGLTSGASTSLTERAPRGPALSITETVLVSLAEATRRPYPSPAAEHPIRP